MSRLLLPAGRATLAVLLLVALGPAAAAQEAEREESQPPAEEVQGVPEDGTPEPGATPALDPDPGDGWRIEGYLDLLYRYRQQDSEDAKDSDLYLGGAIDASLARGDGSDLLRLHFDGLLSADLDGFNSSNEAFSGLQETWNSRTHGFVYGAWVESDTILPDTSVRIGRQVIAPEDVLYFDGARVERPLGGGVSVQAYGGVPVHFYESSTSGDSLIGLGARWAVSRTFALELDELVIRDDTRQFGAASESTAKNRLTLLSAQLLASEAIQLRGSASWVGDQDRRQRLAAYFASPDGSGWTARVDVRRQNDYGEAIVTDLSPYTAVLGDVAPYWNLVTELNKELWEQLLVGGGFQGRWLEDSSDESTYNHDFRRWYGSLTVRDWPADDIGLGARGDLWEAGGDDITSSAFFASWDYSERGRLEAGTDFALYRFDVVSGREKISDRRYYLRARVPVTEQFDLGFRYAIDRSKFGTDQELELVMSLEF